MHAECTGVSGPGYYAAGPRLDVQDVPRKVTAVLYVLRAYVDCRTGGCDRLNTPRKFRGAVSVGGRSDEGDLVVHAAGAARNASPLAPRNLVAFELFNL
jgi:hypothetical protein